MILGLDAWKLRRDTFLKQKHRFHNTWKTLGKYNDSALPATPTHHRGGGRAHPWWVGRGVRASHHIYIYIYYTLHYTSHLLYNIHTCIHRHIDSFDFAWLLGCQVARSLCVIPSFAMPPLTYCNMAVPKYDVTRSRSKKSRNKPKQLNTYTQKSPYTIY